MISLLARLDGAKFAALALAIGTLSPALLAQDQLGREINFVRALAKDMRFIELAKSEAERLATAFRGAGDQDKIAQLSVEVAYYGARSRSDRNQQRALFKETVDKSQDLIDRSTDADVKLQAQSTLANATQDFGQFLIEELDIARTESPERVAELQAEAIEVLKAGKAACKDVRAALESQRGDDPQKEIEFFLMWMKEAVLTREQAKADKENRNVLVDRAIEELEEMVLEAGEESALGLRGLFEIAQCYEVKGEMSEAIDWYSSTIESITTALSDHEKGELQLTGDMLNFLFGMMQEVYVRAGETMAREGAEGTEELFTNFRKHIAQFGEKGVDLFDVVSESYGHLMLLAESRWKAESGDPQKVQEALAMTQRINDKHPADYVGVKAKAVLADILALQKDLVSGSLLFEVGKGELQKKNYEAAVQNLRGAIAALTAEEKKTLGMEAHLMLGNAYRRTDRQLEAIIALVEGAKLYGDKADPISNDAGDAIDRAVSAHKRETKDDPFFASFWSEAINEAAKINTGGADKVAYKEGTKLFNERKWAEAAAEFAKVTSDYVYYEQAAVRVARAYASAGDFAKSREALAKYRQYVAGNELHARDTGKQQVRKAALASGAYNDVQIAYYEARGNDKFGIERDLSKYGAAVDAVNNFLSNFSADGDVYVPQVLAFLGRLHIDTGALDKAEQAYTQLKGKDGTRAARLATEIFKEYQNQVKGLVAELDKGIAAGKTDQQLADQNREIAEARRKLTALGTDYIKSSPEPQLAILVNTMLNWQQLEEWERVDEVAKKTLALYGDVSDEASKNVVDQLVRPMVGEALLQQRRFQEAYDMLIAAEKANPAQWELKRQIARALGGWFEFSKTGAAVREPGLDRPIEAYMKYYGDPEKSYRIWATRPDVKKFSLEWYRFMWESFWFAKQAGKKDSSYEDIADKFYRIARSTNDFATLLTYGAEGKKLHSYFQTNR
ncbi:MAG: hypothetical protein ACE37K_06585 [Planctomycetota bacterium]